MQFRWVQKKIVEVNLGAGDGGAWCWGREKRTSLGEQEEEEEARLVLGLFIYQTIAFPGTS